MQWTAAEERIEISNGGISNGYPSELDVDKVFRRNPTGPVQDGWFKTGERNAHGARGTNGPFLSSVGKRPANERPDTGKQRRKQ